jgi:pimeloyl-ACP methyl ester carboxylesterase
MSRPASRQSASHPEIVSPSWLLRALGLVLLTAFLGAYFVLCILFYQGQWQLVLHPVRSDLNPPAAPHPIRFGPDESAIPQLVGVWLPAPAGARYANLTILFLPSGDGARSDFNPTLEALQSLGLNVFAFDYRGYGYSAKIHPNQKKMTQDADAAWRYLTASRAIAATQIIPYGTGVGASLATHLASVHPEIPAVILDSPYADLLDVALRDSRGTLTPVRLLFRERFPLAEPLTTLKTPKLLIKLKDTPSRAFQTASDPKITVELDSSTGLLFDQAVTRFLDQYLSQSGRQLVPIQTPPDK